jgi:hypothetical protein
VSCKTVSCKIERECLIAKQRNTFAKRQRENDKRRKAEDKRAKRAGKKSGNPAADRPFMSGPANDADEHPTSDADDESSSP